MIISAASDSSLGPTDRATDGTGRARGGGALSTAAAAAAAAATRDGEGRRRTDEATNCEKENQ